MPVGKLTNIALALKKDLGISDKVRIVWLGSNYPEPGEYNQDNDQAALKFILSIDVPFEMVIVRYGDPSGTDAVRVARSEIVENMAGTGPVLPTPVEGRNGGDFSMFGDYSVDLFNHAQMYGEPASRALFDVAAVAIVKNPDWAEASLIPAPELHNGVWLDRPENSRHILIWKNFDRDAIVFDLFDTAKEPVLAS